MFGRVGFFGGSFFFFSPSLPVPWIKQLLGLKFNLWFVSHTLNRLTDVSVDLLVEAILAMTTLYTCVFQVACVPAGTLPC